MFWTAGMRRGGPLALLLCAALSCKSKPAPSVVAPPAAAPTPVATTPAAAPAEPAPAPADAPPTEAPIEKSEELRFVEATADIMCFTRTRKRDPKDKERDALLKPHAFTGKVGTEHYAALSLRGSRDKE